MRKLLCFILIFSYSLCSFAISVDTVFGTINETQPMLIELLDSKALKRLHYIDQSGPSIYFRANFPRFSRYDHSLGVYALLKRYGASELEQAAGLLHDSSHTVFSHLGDLLFQPPAQQTESYQDNIHTWFLGQMQLANTVSKYGITLEDLSPKQPAYTALEQDYPDINADRLEYNLHTALIFGQINQEEVNNILGNLEYKNRKWFFTDINSAKALAKLSTSYTREFWGGADNAALYKIASAALKYALAQKIVSFDSLHFGTDQETIDALYQSKDQTLRKLLSVLEKLDKHYKVASSNDYDLHFPVKMRGIDPLVLQDGELQRLSSLDPEFKAELDATIEYCRHGVYLKLIDIDYEIQDLIVAN